MTIVNQLKDLITQGLTFENCIQAFGVSSQDDPHAKVARENAQQKDDVQVDPLTVVSTGTVGAFVMAWVWVDNESAGLPVNKTR